MDPSRFEHWIKQIYETQPVELSCSECFDTTSLYVEALLAGETPTEPMRRVQQHVEQCRVCFEDFETLYELVRLEREEQKPSTHELP